jgi:hypothetical protein
VNFIEIRVFWCTMSEMMQSCCSGGSFSLDSATKIYSEMAYFMESHQQREHLYDVVKPCDEEETEGKTFVKRYGIKRLSCLRCQEKIDIPICIDHHPDSPLFPIQWGQIVACEEDDKGSDSKVHGMWCCKFPHQKGSLKIMICGTLFGCISITPENQGRFGKVKDEICGICMDKEIASKAINWCWAH